MTAKDHQVLCKCYFAAMWDSLDVAAPGDCSPAIKPKVEFRPIFLLAISFLVEANGWRASTVARFQQARRHSQGVAELGYVCFSIFASCRRFHQSVHPRSQGHPEHRPDLQLCSGIFCRGAASIVVPGILAWVCSGGVSAASESERGQVVAVSNIWTDCVTGFSHRCDPVSGGRRCVGRSPHEKCDWFSVCKGLARRREATHSPEKTGNLCLSKKLRTSCLPGLACGRILCRSTKN